MSKWAGVDPARVVGGRDTVQRRFEDFHAANPAVYDEIVSIARRLKAAGRDYYGIASIFEVIRYHRALTTTEGAQGGYKLNNDYKARYSRLIMAQEPDLEGFFTTRGLTVE